MKILHSVAVLILLITGMTAYSASENTAAHNDSMCLASAEGKPTNSMLKALPLLRRLIAHTGNCEEALLYISDLADQIADHSLSIIDEYPNDMQATISLCASLLSAYIAYVLYYAYQVGGPVAQTLGTLPPLAYSVTMSLEALERFIQAVENGHEE